jgi:hypothetical protein
MQMQGDDKKDSMDKDGDGRVSTEEFVEFAKRREAAKSICITRSGCDPSIHDDSFSISVLFSA